MSMPFYVAPEQVMKDRADYARKGIARGAALAALVYDDGILICAENPSSTLRKVSEIYDRIAFAGVGKYNEFDQLRIAGVRHADLKGYSFSREDVDARSLANAYAQILGEVFTHEMKPMEVEILVAEVGADAGRRPAVPHPLRRHGRRRAGLHGARRRGRGHRRAAQRPATRRAGRLDAALRAAVGGAGRARDAARRRRARGRGAEPRQRPAGVPPARPTPSVGRRRSAADAVAVEAAEDVPTAETDHDRGRRPTAADGRGRRRREADGDARGARRAADEHLSRRQPSRR